MEVYKTQKFIQCLCLIVSLHGDINRHCEEPGCSFQTLEGRCRSIITRLYSMRLLMFPKYDQSRPPCISSGTVDMTMS